MENYISLIVTVIGVLLSWLVIPKIVDYFWDKKHGNPKTKDGHNNSKVQTSKKKKASSTSKSKPDNETRWQEEVTFNHSQYSSDTTPTDPITSKQDELYQHYKESSVTREIASHICPNSIYPYRIIISNDRIVANTQQGNIVYDFVSNGIPVLKEAHYTKYSYDSAIIDYGDTGGMRPQIALA